MSKKKVSKRMARRVKAATPCKPLAVIPPVAQVQHIVNDALIQEMLTAWKPSDRRAGQLIQRRTAVWHYSVALSNRKAVSWCGELHQSGMLVVHDIIPEFTDTVNVVYMPKDRVLENVISSVSAFHNVWRYGWGWNCEHWARLVTTGEPKSYQLDTVVFGLLGLFGFSYREEAIPQLAGHVSSLDRLSAAALAV
jgi:eukaryotic-like serine/threonine-protein kinase